MTPEQPEEINPWESSLQIPIEYQCQNMLSNMLYLIHQGQTNIKIEEFRSPWDKQYRVIIYIEGRLEYITGRTIPEAIAHATEMLKTKERDS